jgi:hypothetical protein
MGGALSVEMRYGGVCDLLVAFAIHSLPRCRCSSLLLLLWTEMVTCGVAASFLSRLVSSVVVGGGSRW